MDAFENVSKSCRIGCMLIIGHIQWNLWSWGVHLRFCTMAVVGLNNSPNHECINFPWCWGRITATATLLSVGLATGKSINEADRHGGGEEEWIRKFHTCSNSRAYNHRSFVRSLWRETSNAALINNDLAEAPLDWSVLLPFYAHRIKHSTYRVVKEIALCPWCTRFSYHLQSFFSSSIGWFL